MNKKKTVKREVNYLFKGEPGKYGKGEKQMTEDDLIEVKPNSKIPSIQITTSFNIYHKKKKFSVSYNTILNILFVLCILLIITFKFIFIDIFISNREKNLKELILNLSFAFIASYIFYNIVIKKSDQIKKKEAYAVICGLLDSVIDRGNDVKKWLLIGANRNEKTDLNKINKTEFKQICSEVDLNKIPSNRKSNIASLILYDGVNRIKFYVDKIFTYMPFLESELIHQINGIQNCKFSVFIIVIPHKEKSNLKEFSLELIEFFGLIDELEIYNNKLKNKYLKNDYERKKL